MEVGENGLKVEKSRKKKAWRLWKNGLEVKRNVQEVEPPSIFFRTSMH